MTFKTTAPIDINQFTIKPSDIGYDTEAGAELSPTARAARPAHGQTAQQRTSSTTNTRPPIMLHPGE